MKHDQSLAGEPIAQAVSEVWWQRLRRMTASLLLAWFLVTVLSIWFARELSGLVFFGWPLPFYLAAQGALLCYLALVGLYAWRADRLERSLKNETGPVHGD